MSVIQERIRGVERDIGFTVQRALPAAARRSVGPFVFLDHMGPARFRTGSTEGDVRPHPHIGLATVTYLFAGAMMHRDSLGSVQRIEPGAVNWMTAGSGITHSERLPDDVREKNIQVEGMQMWVALPKDQEDGPSGFWHYGAEVLPVLEKPACTVRVLCGSFDGASSPVKTPCPTIFMAADMRSQGVLILPPDYEERAIYVVCGTVEIDGEAVGENELVVLEPGQTVRVMAVEEVRLMVLGGAPLDGPRFMWWNFVSSDKQKILEAQERWRAQEFPKVPGETEFIPLPER